jgi:AraC-like DNA-binding protein
MRRKEIQVILGVKAHIDNNLQKDLHIKKLCPEFGLNKNKLQAGFRLLFGLTIHAYIVKAKMQQAAEMLKNTNDPIKAIALDLGFTESNFHTNFKKSFGHSPKQFRKKENCR